MRVAILAVAGCCVGVLAALAGFAYIRAGRTGCTGFELSVEPPRVVWTFEPPERGSIISTPLVTPDQVFVAAIEDHGLSTGGAVYCLERDTGKPVWKFDDDGEMQHTYSSPCLWEGKLYVGEGMHANHLCKFYCLDAATGKKLWHHETAGHIESSPCVADGRVYFCSGDDGVYCLDARTGKECWHFKEELHLDASPAVAVGRLYVGCGVSRRFQTTQVLCLDAATGSVLWRLPTELPAWGSPAVDGDQVFFGLGNGRLVRSAEPPVKPAGALLCVRATTGQRWWSYPVGDAVLAWPTVGTQAVYFGCRDGFTYAIDRREGTLCWKHPLGSAVVTSVALSEDRAFAVSGEGRVASFSADAGGLRWEFDIGKHAQARPQVFSSPVVAASGDGDTRIYIGAELKGPGSSAAILYCLRD